jgi:hypothetical protein
VADRPRVGEELEREEPRDPSQADVQRWVTMYADLTAFTQEMLDRTTRFLAAMPGPAQRHLRNTNVQVMEEELAAFRERLAVWQERARRSGLPADQSGTGSADSSTPAQ